MTPEEREAEIARVKGLIEALGPQDTWVKRKNAKGNAFALQAYLVRLRDLEAGHNPG